ncbi:type IV pilus modification PilV family protein [Vibrio metschnikovii]|uniref:Prepilin-type N-terminal cleavage/methylation domain-containing protein n=1 Tax=Vibrio metschnikovii TaxID=28172 RepID=A0A9X0R537_VIBME|nr:prepilin-type N-terminal cleavage/methylation domain-containing protein [Vibrio metschnikovii]MBC3617470.1 prepilin-type N-terminal cleavage/methylation domain-containing protein [Vibrio metschnikovii]MBC3620361.1 prepilin-type N-terminal cleavage/methylation domain-containing protein [Vibrio metschnikovii]MBC5813379.1 prepilin-type N-terminal cleavage/methylation domain-containing protein [Vibrio metschnikovii]MBC5832530.1 prepilin-type N-terminal cleavage/methylation domain-containing prot
MAIKQRGFSLIEVMIAFVLIGVGALSLVKLQTFVEQRADFAQHSITALNLAEQKLEWFRTRGASAATASLVASYPHDFVAGEDSSHPLYLLQWSVPSTQLSGALKTIVVQATWKDRYGKDQSVQLKTMISQHSEFD